MRHNKSSSKSVVFTRCPCFGTGWLFLVGYRNKSASDSIKRNTKTIRVFNEFRVKCDCDNGYRPYEGIIYKIDQRYVEIRIKEENQSTNRNKKDERN